MKTRMMFLAVGLCILSMMNGVIATAEAETCKVLVIQTFSEGFFWSSDIKTGIESAIKDQCELRHFYFNAEVQPDGVAQKAAEAYAIYQEWQPDGVIAADESVQEFFVVPHLKDKVTTPVMFCGIFSPEPFGYPATNVSGAAQRAYFRESFAFLQQLTPSVKIVTGIVNDNEAGRTGAAIFENEMKALGMQAFPTIIGNDPKAMLAQVEQIKSQADALFVTPSLDGLQQGMVKQVVATFGKPTYTGWRPAVEQGVLCGVVEDSKGLGRLAAEMLLKAMHGTPVSELPVAYNEFGTRMINVTTLKTLGIEPSRRLLTGVELIK